MTNKLKAPLDATILLVLTSLISISIASIVLRLNGWSVKQPASDLPMTPKLLPLHLDSFQLEVMRPEIQQVEPVKYQLAAMINENKPSATLKKRRIYSSDKGHVAIGQAVNGAWMLQTCLMATGRSAVTFTQMQSEVMQTVPAKQRFARVLKSLFLGMPWHDSSCKLVLIMDREALGVSEQVTRQRLLHAWQKIRPLIRQG